MLTLCLESEWQEARAAINHVLALDPANSQAKQLNEQLDAMERKN
jgi:hypothetical protein